MEKTNEKRSEQRLHYEWPVWFGEDFEQTRFAGQMLDVSSGGAAFKCRCGENRPLPGRNIIARFSVPRFGSAETFNKVIFTKTGRVCRTHSLDRASHRVAIEFDKPLFFRPGEQGISQTEAQQKLATVMV